MFWSDPESPPDADLSWEAPCAVPEANAASPAGALAWLRWAQSAADASHTLAFEQSLRASRRLAQTVREIHQLLDTEAPPPQV